ncbi:transient receptor potential cation channel subfamily A member 1 homolog [Bacillus rossius redtenbacheri]|uniref:transient receptor potential cation channel subfamily A member 1 homolog n=1 Tax=Bacillus rossius redtenbacheri TaxID=93214 RepID=UPI002FDE2CD3
MNLERLRYGRLPLDGADDVPVAGSPPGPADEQALLWGSPPLVLLTPSPDEDSAALDELLLQPVAGQGVIAQGAEKGGAAELRDPYRKRRRWWKRARLSQQSASSQGGPQRRQHRRRERLNTELLVAVAAGHVKEADRCLRQGSSPNASCAPTWTSASHVAALMGRADILGLLLEKGADPLQRLRDGASLLHLAAWGGGAECVELVARAAPQLVSCPVKAGTSRLLDEWRDSCQHDHVSVSDMHDHVSLNDMVSTCTWPFVPARCWTSGATRASTTTSPSVTCRLLDEWRDSCQHDHVSLSDMVSTCTWPFVPARCWTSGATRASTTTSPSVTCRLLDEWRDSCQHDYVSLSDMVSTCTWPFVPARCWTSGATRASTTTSPSVTCRLLDEWRDSCQHDHVSLSDMVSTCTWPFVPARCWTSGATRASTTTSPSVTCRLLDEWRDSCQHDHVSLSDMWCDSCQHDHVSVSDMLPTLHKESTPLHVASQRANADALEVLLSHGADVAAADEDGLSPLDVVGETLSADSHQRAGLGASIRALLAAGGWTSLGEEEEEQLGEGAAGARQHRTTAVHSAVRLRDPEALELLAGAEVSPLALDLHGFTPVHLAVSEQLGDSLKVLLQAYESRGATIVDLPDIRGRTALHQAVASGWLEGVCILLEAGADVSVQEGAMGLTAVHMAAERARPDILREFIAMDDIDVSTLNAADKAGDTPLALAVESRSLPCVRLLLEEGADVSRPVADDCTVLHLAAKYDEPDILEELLKGASTAGPALLAATAGRTGETALHLAARAGHLRCCELLLHAGGDPGLASGPQRRDTPLHLAAAAGHCEVARLLLQARPAALELEDSSGRTPLLLACLAGRRECARLLVAAGADLSADCREGDGQRVVTAMDLLFSKTPRPVDLLRDLFDAAVSVNDYPPDDHRCEVSLDFSVLTPSGKHVGQMKVLDAFVNTGNTYRQHELLLHPLVKSFLFLKWRRLSAMFYAILADFAAFVLALTALCCDLYLLPDRGRDPVFDVGAAVWRTLTFLFLGVFVLQEVAHAVCFPRFYLRELESWLKWACFTLAAVTASVQKDDGHGWRRDLAAVSVLLAWTELMFLLSRLPNLGYFVLMFFKVTTNMCKVLLTFAFIFLGFTLSFMILFRNEEPFTSPFRALAKVVVMMTGELEYSDVFGGEEVAARACARLVFLTFAILVGVVLMNLMVGLAVSDIGVLESKGLIGRLRKQVDFLRMLEYFLYSERCLRCLPGAVVGKVTELRKVKEVCRIYPGRTDVDVTQHLSSRLRHEVMFHVFERKRCDAEYTLKDVYEKISDVLEPRATLDDPKHRGVFDVLAEIKDDLEEIRKDLPGGSVRRLSAATPNKIDTLLTNVDSIRLTLNVILNKLSIDHHVVEVS